MIASFCCLSPRSRSCRTRRSPARSTSRSREGTSMAAAASPDRRSIAIDLLGGIWILPDARRRGEAHHAGAARGAPAHLVARQPVDRLPGLRRRRVAHLRDPARRRRGEGDHQRRVRRSRAGVVARRIADRVLLRSLRRHHDDLGSAVATGEVRQFSTRDGWMPAWSPNDQEITFVSADAGERSRRGAIRRPACGPSAPDGRERHISDRREGRQACRRRPRGARTARRLALRRGARRSVCRPRPGRSTRRSTSSRSSRTGSRRHRASSTRRTATI